MALTRQRSYDEFGDFSGSATILDDAARTPVSLLKSMRVKRLQNNSVQRTALCGKYTFCVFVS